MNSHILAISARYLGLLLLQASIILLLRGHNEPGGGFVGGLVAAASFALYAFAFGVDRAREALRVNPRYLIGLGLLLAVVSGVFGLISGAPFMTGLWSDVPIPVLGKVGTPVLFDVGVDLVVIGVTLTIVFSLAESDE